MAGEIFSAKGAGLETGGAKSEGQTSWFSVPSFNTSPFQSSIPEKSHFVASEGRLEDNMRRRIDNVNAALELARQDAASHRSKAVQGELFLCATVVA